jgi:hypothetical protein
MQVEASMGTSLSYLVEQIGNGFTDKEDRRSTWLLFPGVGNPPPTQMCYFLGDKISIHIFIMEEVQMFALMG